MTDKFNEKTSVSKRKKLNKVIEKRRINPKSKEIIAQLNSDSVSQGHANQSKTKLPKEKISRPHAEKLDLLKAKAKAARSANYKAAKERLKADPKFNELLAKKKEAQKALRKELLLKRKSQLKLEKTKHLSPEDGLEEVKKQRSWPKQSIPKNGRTKLSRSMPNEKRSFDNDNSLHEIAIEDKFFKNDKTLDRSREKHEFHDKNAESVQIRAEKTPANIQNFRTKVEDQTSRSYEEKDNKNNRSNSKMTGKTKPQKEILLRTGSNSELRTLAEIIAVDFINKKRKKSDKTR